MTDIEIKLPNSVLEIFSVIVEYGAEAYVVGGCVRDSIMCREPHDWDICTPVLAPELQALFEDKGYRVIPTGLQHGTITVIIDEKGYEITQFRRDGDYSDGRHPDNVEFTSNLIEDLERRDFTINAMAYNPMVGLIDPFDGIRDIRNRRIMCVGSARKRFKEDALRILRAIRFAAQLDFSIASDTSLEILMQYKNLENISIERINSEFIKIAKTAKLGEELARYGSVFWLFIPELKDMFRFPQNNPYHCYDVWSHTLIAIDNCSSEDLITRLAVLFHDIGKPHCYQDDDGGVRHFKGHGRVSAGMTDSIMRRLRFDNDTREKVVELIYYHDATFEVGTKYVKRWLNKIGEKQFRRLLELRKADVKAQNPIYMGERLEKILDIESVLENILIGRQCFAIGDLAINGNDVMRIMGIKEGKDVGYWLNEILNRIIDGQLKNDRDELTHWMTGITDGWIIF